MSDDRAFGRNDGIVCQVCGSPTFRAWDQGDGLVSYQCEADASHVVQAQYDEEDLDTRMDGWDPLTDANMEELEWENL